jgi:hypothetical protein
LIQKIFIELGPQIARITMVLRFQLNCRNRADLPDLLHARMRGDTLQMGPVTRRDRLDSFKQEKAISMLLRYPGVALSLLLFNAYLLVVPASMAQTHT